MQTIVYHSKARKTMCGMGTFCLIGMISFQLTMQNGDLVVGKVGFPPAPAGKQEVSILFPTKMRGVPHIFVSWRDTDNTLSAVNGLVITDSTDSGFKIATNRIDTEYTWWFSFMAIYR